MEKGLVSIIIPCFNSEIFLDKCLHSLLNQTYKKIEVIIINDGSTDNSEQIIDKYIKKFKKNGMKLIKINQINQGQAAAVNNGLKLATGEYMMWQDSDDWYEYDAVESLLNLILKEKCSFVRGKVAYRDENDLENILNYGESKDKKNRNIFYDYVFEKNSYCFPGIFMVKMELIDQTIKNREIYVSRAGQNWQLILPISYKNKCFYLDKVVYNYRIVSNSHSRRNKSLKDDMIKCNMHKDILFNVIDTIDLNLKDDLFLKMRINFKYFVKKAKIIVKFFKKVLIDGNK